MSLKPRSIPTKTLAQNLSSSGTTLYLNNTLDWDDAQLSSADFGTQAFAVLRNAANTQIEFIEIDPTTVTSAAAITITKRGLGYDGTQVANTETKYNWNAFDTYVELGADTPQLLAQLVEEAGDETIAGVKTFSSIPLTTGGSPTTDNQLARKAYVDAAVSGGSGIPNRVVVSGTAGETVAAGNLVYLKASDNRWWLCDADTVATVENIQLGIAQGAGTAGNAVTSGVLIFGVDSNQAGLTANTKYFASNTAGGLSSSAGTTEVTIGLSLSTTSILFIPRYDQQITEDIQDGLASTTALAAGNKVVSQKDFQIGAEVYAASSGGSDTYAITLSPAPAAYVTGMTFRFKADVANTGAATLNVNSLGAKTIKKNVSADLQTNDILANQIVTVQYDGTNFQLVNYVNAGITRLAGLADQADTNENTVFTTTLPGGLLSKSGMIRISTPVTFNADNAGGTMTIRLKYGGSTRTTLIVTLGALGGGNISYFSGVLSGLIVNNNATNAQFVGLYLHGGIGNSAGTNITAVYVSTQPADTTSAIDTTADQTLALTAQKSASNVGACVFYQTIIETKLN